MVGVLSFLIWVGAPYMGASMNTARSLGSATEASRWSLLWVYFVGPPLGALLAAGLFRVFLPERRTLTAKPFNDERYPITPCAASWPAHRRACR